MEKENKNKIGLAILLIAIVLFAGGLTYAFFTVNVTEAQEKLTVTTGTLKLTFSDNNPGITADSLQFGQSTTKEFMIKNTGSLPVETTMLWSNLVNTYLKESLSYTLQYKTSVAGDWETTPIASGNIPRSASAQDFNLAEKFTIPVDATYYYKLTITLNDLTNVNQTIDTNAVLTSSFKLGDAVVLTDVDKTLLALGKFKNDSAPIFADAVTEDETKDGLYSMVDDYGTSYYYRGAVEDNYVKFGRYDDNYPDEYIGFESSTNVYRPKSYSSLEECQNSSSYNYNCTKISRAGKDMWWRIVRINGDGSVRMIYDGTQGYANANSGTGSGGADRFIAADQPWNTTNTNDNKYVGYKYGGANGAESTSVSQAQTNETDTNIKTILDTWYETNLKTPYGAYIADAVFCNDRSMSPTAQQWWTKEGTTNRGFGSTATAYGAFSRFFTTTASLNTTSLSPKFTCEKENDMFTVSQNTVGSKKTNGSLKDPVGLITADEVVAAGSVPKTNSKYYYLYKNSNHCYWTLSPSTMGTSGNAHVFGVHGKGILEWYNVINSCAVAPVINISKEYASTLTGSGTMESPFQIPGAA